MKKLVAIISILAISLLAVGCASTNITSAKLYIQQKNYKKAQEALQKEITKNPKSDEGYYLLGYVYGQMENIPDMIKNFDKSLEISKKFEKDVNDSKKYYWQTSFNRGVNYFNKGAKAAAPDTAKIFYNKAIETFNNGILCQPDSVGTYKNLAFAYMNLGDKDKAIEPLKKIVELSKTADSYAMLGEIYYNKGVQLQSEGDSAKAMELFDKTLALLGEGKKLHSSDTNILMLLSNTYVAANKLDVAMDTFKESVAADPENKIYRYNYGVLLLGAKDYDNAAEQFAKAIALDSEYMVAYYNLGVTYLKQGAEAQQKAIDEDSGDESYKEYFKQCVDPLKKYLELKPEDSKVWEFLGKVYANLGMGDESKDAFEKADQYRQ